MHESEELFSLKKHNTKQHVKNSKKINYLDDKTTKAMTIVKIHAIATA